MITSLENTEDTINVVFAVGSSPRTPTRMQESEGNFGNPVLRVQRLESDGTRRRQNRAFRPSYAPLVFASATLEEELRRQHRRGNREATNHPQWKPEEGSVAEEPQDEGTLYASWLVAAGEDCGSQNHDSQQAFGDAVGFEAHLRQGILVDAGKHGWQPPETVWSQAPVVNGSLPAFRFGGRAQKSHSHDGEN